MAFDLLTDRRKKLHGENRRRPVEDWEDWGKLLGDSAVTAMLDRLPHHGHILKCGPRSWRTNPGTAEKPNDKINKEAGQKRPGNVAFRDPRTSTTKLHQKNGDRNTKPSQSQPSRPTCKGSQSPILSAASSALDVSARHAAPDYLVSLSLLDAGTQEQPAHGGNAKLFAATKRARSELLWPSSTVELTQCGQLTRDLGYFRFCHHIQKIHIQRLNYVLFIFVQAL